MPDATTRAPGRRYNFADHGNSEMGARQGNYLVRNNTMDVWSPAFGGGFTTIRIFPGRDPNDPSGQAWDPYRLSFDEPRRYGDWIRRYSAVRSFGDPGVTMIIGDPAELTEDRFASPAWVLYNAIDRAISNKQEGQGWAAMMKGGNNRGAQLSRPSEIYVVQCCIMQHKTKVYNPPQGLPADQKTVLFQMGPSAAQAMLNELDILNPQYDGQTAHPEAIYANGDPVSLDYGRFVTFFKLGEDPRVANQPAAQANWNLAGSQQGGMQSREREPIGHGCYLSTSFGPVSPVLRPYEPFVQAKVRRWDDVLYFPTIEEQAAILADKFPADVIMYGWRDHPHWIPDAVRQRAVHSVSAAVPGFSPGYGAPPATTYPGAYPGGPGMPPLSAAFGAAPPTAPGYPPGYAPPPVQAAPPPVAPPPVAFPGAPAAPPQYAPPVAPQYAPPVAPQAAPGYQPPYAPPVAPAPAPAPAPVYAPPAAPAQPAPQWMGMGNPMAPQPPGPVLDPAMPAGQFPPMAPLGAPAAPAPVPPLAANPFAPRPGEAPAAAPVYPAAPPAPVAPPYQPPAPYQQPAPAYQQPAAPPMAPGYPPGYAPPPPPAPVAPPPGVPGAPGGRASLALQAVMAAQGQVPPPPQQ